MISLINDHWPPISVPAVRPKRRHTLSNPAHRQDYTVACLNYTLQTMMPLPGWPVMAPNAYDNNNIDLAYGIVCQPSCESWILHSDNFYEHSKRIYVVTDNCSAEWQCFSCAVYKFAYLLTYLNGTWKRPVNNAGCNQANTPGSSQRRRWREQFHQTHVKTPSPTTSETPRPICPHRRLSSADMQHVASSVNSQRQTCTEQHPTNY